ncbi:MAG: hypothetical protein LC804_28480 [Acidobacteria bacterium]|nr:hypothetical protein [Acidobacteriota bacterium]
MTALFRTIAIAIALAAALDPPVSIARSGPLMVEILSSGRVEATAVRDRLMSHLGGGAQAAHPGHGHALVAIDRVVAPQSIRDKVPVSVVSMTGAPNVRLLHAAAQSDFLPGQEAALDVEADVRNLEGRTSILTITRDGVEVGRIQQRWSAAARQRVTLSFVAFEAGVHAVRVTAVPLDEETRRDDNAVDAKVVSISRALRIAFFESRPSWSAGFVRRAVETYPPFEVVSLLRASRGVEVRVGDAPAALTTSRLDRFDVVAVGAPEDLSAPDLAALNSFMTDRGGTVLLLPDRRPSGPPLAVLTDGRPVISAWPVGNGTLIFSGALDAWRFRADSGDRFAAFWRAAIAAVALVAPARLHVELDPPVSPAGAPTRVVVRIRRTELQRDPDSSTRVPEVRAVAVARRGRTSTTETLRLWPAPEPGVFTGEFVPESTGEYYVHVTAGRAQDAVRLLQTSHPAAGGGDDEESAMIASATGGVVTTADNLAPLAEHLRSLSRPDVRATARPMRSSWWTLPFALALAAEWTLRRRRGSR